MTSPSATAGCWSRSTTITRSATSTSPTSGRKTTPAPARAASASTPTSRARHRSGLFWTDDAHGWQIRQRYLRDTLTTSVSLDHRELRLALYCNDTVDFHRNILVRKIKVKNLAHHERVVQHHAPPGLQHVRDEDRRHRLLRPRAALDRPLPRQALPDGDVLRRRRAAHRRIRHRHQRIPRRRGDLARRRGRPPPGQPDRPGGGRFDHLPPRAPAPDGETDGLHGRSSPAIRARSCWSCTSGW